VQSGVLLSLYMTSGMVVPETRAKDMSVLWYTNMGGGVGGGGGGGGGFFFSIDQKTCQKPPDQFPVSKTS